MPVLLVMSMPNAFAKKSATTYSDITDTSIRTAGPEGNPFYNFHWLAKDDIENQTQTHHYTHTTNMAHSPPPKIWYLPNHRDALQAHMHLLHKLGNAKTESKLPCVLPDPHKGWHYQ
jgi:hypothetical protein